MSTIQPTGSVGDERPPNIREAPAPDEKKVRKPVSKRKKALFAVVALLILIRLDRVPHAGRLLLLHLALAVGMLLLGQLRDPRNRLLRFVRSYYFMLLVLLFYSLGLGVPFLVASVALAGAFSAFDRIKRYLTPITVASGVFLAMFGVLLLTGRITDLNAWFSEMLIRFGLEGLAEV